MIDWTKPIEHVDGTPLVEAGYSDINGTHTSPDAQGDYYFKREDGKPFTEDQAMQPYVLIVRPDGSAWGIAWGIGHDPIVRNRKSIEEQETKSMTKYAFNLATDTVKEQPVEVTLELVHREGDVYLIARTATGDKQCVATFKPGAKAEFHAMYNTDVCAAFGIEHGERIA